MLRLYPFAWASRSAPFARIVALVALRAWRGESGLNSRAEFCGLRARERDDKRESGRLLSSARRSARVELQPIGLRCKVCPQISSPTTDWQKTDRRVWVASSSTDFLNWIDGKELEEPGQKIERICPFLWSRILGLGTSRAFGASRAVGTLDARSKPLSSGVEACWNPFDLWGHASDLAQVASGANSEAPKPQARLMRPPELT